MLRTFVVAFTLAIIGLPSTASGQAASYLAGITRIDVPWTPAFSALVWYPTRVEGRPWQVGPFSIPASHDAPVATGSFPIILLSHGGGASGGTPLLLGDLSASLARHGFVVLAPFHGRSQLSARPLQAKLALDALLADPRFQPHANAARLGMVGFSLGGAVTLEIAGAVPNLNHIESYCRTHPTDLMSCRNGPDRSHAQSTPLPASASEPLPPIPRLPLRAIALLDPLAVPFQSTELRAVTMPVLLLRPERSEFPGEVNALGLLAGLPHAPKYQTIPGRHFVFTDVCNQVLQSEEPELCSDPPGVSRMIVHAQIESLIAAFFAEHL